MIEVLVRLDDEGKLGVAVGGEPQSPVTYIGLLELAKQMVMSRKPEEPRIVSVSGAEAQAIANKAKVVV